MTRGPQALENTIRTPLIAKAAVEVLEHAGYRVRVPQVSLCCGRPLYDYGMLDTGQETHRNAASLCARLRMGLNESPSGPAFDLPEKRYTEAQRTTAIPVSIIAAGAILGVSAWWYSRHRL